MQPAPAIRGNPYRGGGPRRGRLTSEQDVLEDIIATSNGDFNQYSDIVPLDNYGQLQYTPTPTIVWPNADVLKNAIMQLQETKRITAEQEKAERIANAINSAVVFLPTGIKAKAIMFTIVIGTSGLLFVRRPWANGWTLNSVVDTLMYTSLVGISFYILMKMSNAVSEAKRFAPTSNPILTP
tara:strand:+ start:34 stop:579 length:546 start_codon:yes stop_codon:yes gene_type:complete